jgi:plasmid maintenance system killer protein
VGLHPRLTLLLDIMDNVESLEDLQVEAFPPDLRLHGLKGEKKGRYAIDIHKTQEWRITFEFSDNKFHRVVVENYHKG